MTRTMKRAVPVLLAVVVLALLVAGGVLGWRAWQDRETEQARRNAVDAASRQAVAMLAYDAQTVDQVLPKAADGLTGSFRDDYAKLINETIIPAAKQKQLTVKVDVQGGSVVRASRDEVVVLLFIDQTTTGKDTPQAVASGSRLRMTMEHVGGRWLASDLKPI